MSSLTAAEIKKMVAPVLRKYGVVRAGLFGSAASRKMKRGSDVDLLVKVDDSVSLYTFVKLKQALERSLKRKVDLVEYSSLKPSLKKGILESEVRIYEAG